MGIKNGNYVGSIMRLFLLYTLNDTGRVRSGHNRLWLYSVLLVINIRVELGNWQELAMAGYAHERKICMVSYFICYK